LYRSIDLYFHRIGFLKGCWRILDQLEKKYINIYFDIWLVFPIYCIHTCSTNNYPFDEYNKLLIGRHNNIFLPFLFSSVWTHFFIKTDIFYSHFGHNFDLPSIPQNKSFVNVFVTISTSTRALKFHFLLFIKFC